MEFKGRITKVLPVAEGISDKTGNPWKSQEFIVEYFENPTDRYADSVVLKTMDENIMAQLKEGTDVLVGFGHSAREWQGRYFNNLRLYKFQVLSGAQQPAGTTQQPAGGSNAPHANNNPQPAQSPATGDGNGQNKEGGDEDDLPF